MTPPLTYDGRNRVCVTTIVHSRDDGILRPPPVERQRRQRHRRRVISPDLERLRHGGVQGELRRPAGGGEVGSPTLTRCLGQRGRL